MIAASAAASVSCITTSWAVAAAASGGTGSNGRLDRPPQQTDKGSIGSEEGHVTSGGDRSDGGGDRRLVRSTPTPPVAAGRSARSLAVASAAKMAARGGPSRRGDESTRNKLGRGPKQHAGDHTWMATLRTTGEGPTRSIMDPLRRARLVTILEKNGDLANQLSITLPFLAVVADAPDH